MNKKIKDLTGKVFGKLTVIGIDEERSNRKTYWTCICECGKITSVRSDTLQKYQVSCGCEKTKKFIDRNHKRAKHLMSGTRLYKIWQGIKSRTGKINTKNKSHIERYFEKGIQMCDEWADSFNCFYDWAMANGYKEDLTIDRINNNGNYEPSNCRWATAEEQANNRDSNILIRIGNATKTLMEWCKIFEVNYNTVKKRYYRTEDTSLEYLFEPRL